MHRKRRYSTDEIKIPSKLKRTNSDTNISASNAEPYNEISHHDGKLNIFSTYYYVTEFVLKNAISYPEEKLKNIFANLINRAYTKCNLMGKQVGIPK